MQILPLSSEPITPLVAQNQASSSTSFDDVLSEEELSAESLQENVYAKHAKNGHTYTLDEVSFTQNELKTLVNDLVQNNAPQKSLEKLQKLTELPDGASLGQVMQALKGSKKASDLSDEDANAITGFADAIDPSGILANQMLQALYDNKPLDALRALGKALEEMDANARIHVDKDDVLALGRALGLSEQSQEKLAALFGDAQSGEVTPSQMQKLLAPATEEILTAKTNQQALDQALAKTLDPLLKNAKKRMEQEQAAVTIKDRNAQHSQVMIDKTVQRESRKTLDTILDAQNRNQLHAAKEHADLDLTEASHEDLEHFGISQLDILRFKGAQPKNPDSSFNDKGSRDHGEESLFQRGFDRMPLLLAEPALFEPLPTMQPKATMPLAQHLSNQVQSGLMTSLANGTTRLDIQLHPQELGTLAISLVSNNGSINAVIRADKAETVEMLNRQAEAIKMSLEQQGIKIDSLEIELKNSSDQANGDQQFLQDMNNHNAFQEENARRDHLRRLRTLAAVEGKTENVEQNMHSEGKTNNRATRILDRVA
ncbi:MAG: flagellar hook-length control protein FliK [Desulfovibrio sp.]|nr:flagellar hook-length control protein FliK [Desulfovibrio sp.]